MKPFVVPMVVLLSLTGVSAALLYVLLKKDADDEDLEPSIFTARQTIIKMKIPKELVGVLIGRAGANIKAIQSESCARVSFDKCEAPSDEFRDCTIFGTAVAAQKAETMIHEFIQNQPKIETYEMLVHQKSCGRIIGRGGQNIRHISTTSHAKIVLTDEDGDDRKVVIKGTADQIAIARDLILNILNEYNTSMEELRDSIQNRSPRVSPKWHLNGPPELQTNLDYSEMLTPPGGDKSLEVFVSAVERPDRFWVQVINEKGTILDKLLDDMTDYYSDTNNQELHKLSDLNEGQIVAALFPEDEKWYRAHIVSLRNSDDSEDKTQVEVFYVDYGDSKVLDKNKVMELRTDFLELRFQAIQCFLAGVKPINEDWSDEAIDSFEDLSHAAQWVKLSLNIKTYEHRNKSLNKEVKLLVPGVELFHQKDNGWVNIGSELVERGFAVKTDDFNSSPSNGFPANETDDQPTRNQYREIPELSDSGSDIDGFYVEC